MTGEPGGYFPIPNGLLAEGCRRPVALACYARLASIPHIWTERGSLQPYEVRASRADLVDATGTSPKQVRGALAWLIRNGFLVRLDTSRKAKAAFRVVTGAKPNPSSPTTYREPGPRSSKKGQAKGQDGAKDKPLSANGLPSAPQSPRAKPGAKVLEEVEDKTTTPPPTPPRREEDVVSLWYDAWDGDPPPEPKATRNADKYCRTVLGRATAGETVEDVRRMFASWVEATDPDWGQRQADGVAEFAKRVGRWVECRNVERAHSERKATVTSSPGNGQHPGALTALADIPALAALTGEQVEVSKPETPTRPEIVKPPEPNAWADVPQGQRGERLREMMDRTVVA